MWNAKSSTEAPYGSLYKSPLGENTNTSLSYMSMRMFFISSIGPVSAVSRMSRTLFIHVSSPSSLRIPLYFQCAASPFSATRSIRLVRICTSTQRSSGPCTVMCNDSYPLLLGMLSQSFMREGFGWYMSVTTEYAIQQSLFSFSGSESMIMRIANRSYMWSMSLFCFLILFHME